MPSFKELPEIGSGAGYEIREHSVNRQDASKPSYVWPKVRITDTPDWNVFLAEWYETVGGGNNGHLEDLVTNGLNHSISVVKDPARISSDPEVIEFKAKFRHAISLWKSNKALAREIMEELKTIDLELLEELKKAHTEKIMSQVEILD